MCILQFVKKTKDSARIFRLHLRFLLSLSLLTACSDNVQIQSYRIQASDLDSIGDIVGEHAFTSMFQDAGGTKFVLLQIETDPNLVSLIEKSGPYIGANLWFCDKPDQEVLLGDGVYQDGQHVNLWQIKHERSPAKHQTFDEFDIVIFQAWEIDRELVDAFANPRPQTHYLKYDNKSDPADICVALHGGRGLIPVKSNTIVIPSDSVRAVFN